MNALSVGFVRTALLALLASIGFHLGAAAIVDKQEMRVAGGETAQPAALGSSFENLVAAGDRLSPVDQQTEATPVEPPLPLPTVTPSVTEQVTQVPENSPVDPAAAPDALAPAIAAIAPLPPQDIIEARPDEPILPMPRARPLRQIEVDRAEAEQRRQAEKAAERERRRAERERRRAEERQRARRQRQARGSDRGRSNRNARAGRADGRAEGRRANARQGSRRARQAGNAAASNYPGRVYAKIRRTRQRPVGERGTVRVRFSVSASGGLASISIASSSGSGAINRAALDHIRRAAPFPAPPPGARRRFVIPVKFRR